MKQFICVAALLCGSALTAHAQTTAGTLLLGGGLSVSSEKTEDTALNYEGTAKNKGFTLAPRVGYFVRDNFVVGLEARYGYSTANTERTGYYGNNTATSSGHAYSAGPFVRYYKMVGEKAGFFGQAGALYQRTTSESEGASPNAYTSESTGRGASAYFMPGFAFFPTSKLGLELMLGSVGYGTFKADNTTTYLTEPTSTSTTRTSGLGGNFNLSSMTVGAVFYLGH